MSAYTAPMQNPHPQAIKRLIALSGISILTALTSGCYTPSSSYCRQPVAYVPEAPYYAGSYNYSACNPVLIPVETPGYVWNASCSPHPHYWRHDEDNEQGPCHEKQVSYYRPQEISGNPHRPQHQQYASRPAFDQKSIPHHSQPPVQLPPSAAPGYATPRNPSFANN